MARVDEDGYFFIVDRKKDMIIRGGYNVYPREIEEVLYEHPAVREAAVVGVPHAELGEEVGAAVALKAGADATPAELRAYVKEQVAAYKYPRRCGSSTSCPRARPARSSSARSSCPSRSHRRPSSPTASARSCARWPTRSCGRSPATRTRRASGPRAAAISAPTRASPMRCSACRPRSAGLLALLDGLHVLGFVAGSRRSREQLLRDVALMGAAPAAGMNALIVSNAGVRLFRT